MRREIADKLISYGKENETIESIFYIRNDNYDSFNKAFFILNEIIIAKLEDELVGLFDDVILLNRTKEERNIDKEKISYTNINIYKSDNTKLTVSVISADNADQFINALPSDIEFIYNRPGFERLNPNPNFRYNQIKEYEFVSTIRNFFAKALEVSFYINEKDELAASLKMDDLREDLLSMLNFYVEDKYSYTMNMGIDGQRLKKTLEIDYKEDFLYTFPHDDFMDIYDSLFKACGLFRRIGLDLSGKFGFAYPREIDVNTLKVLRANYKKLESFLS